MTGSISILYMNLSVLAKLVAKGINLYDYTTYVFEFLEQDEIENYQTKYFMCIRFPNWECREIDIGEIGWVELQENFAGKSTWWDGTTYHLYKYDSLQFIKFIPRPDQTVKEITL